MADEKNPKRISILGALDRVAGMGVIGFIVPMPGVPLTPLDEKSNITIRCFDKAGTLLDILPLTTNELVYDPTMRLKEGMGEVAQFKAVLDMPASTKKIELALDDHVVDTFPRKSLDDGVEEYEVYIVQVRGDNETNWRTEYVGHNPTSFALETSKFPGAKRVLIRLLVSDGFDVAIAKEQSIAIKSRA